MKISHIAVAALAGAAITGAAFAEDIRWMTQVAPDARHFVTGAPDFLSVPADGFTVSVPGQIHKYDPLGRLSSTLADLKLVRGQLIAFESNGGSGAAPFGGWESSRWHFRDDVHPAGFNYEYNETLDVAANNDANNRVPAVVSSGPIDGSDYATFFGMCCRAVEDAVMSYIVFDLAAMAIDPATVSVSISGWPTATTGEGSPDPEAIGVIDSCGGGNGVCMP